MQNIESDSILHNFFELNTMSVHFKENVHTLIKKWKPWNRISEKLEDIPSKNYLINLIDWLFKEVNEKEDWFLEIDRKYSKVLQIWPYRIVIVLPPLSDWIEITVVKPVKKLSIKDYDLDEKVIEIFKNRSKWILISWSPWEWKTTFAQAILDLYLEMNKVIKTIESPRDLVVPDDVTQYSFSYAPHSEIRDILLLSRPDYTVYDEIRNTEDFQLYKDLRLTWIWLIWVIHATNPVDSIQRFIWSVEMWVIPQVIDTVVFIKSWRVESILWLKQIVKVPEWMESEDLARPVIQVYEYKSEEIKYEIYSYGEQVVVMPLSEVQNFEENKNFPVWEYAEKYLNNYISELIWIKVNVEVESKKWIKIYVPEKNKWKIIWKWWEKIQELEKRLWLSISVRAIWELKDTKSQKCNIEIYEWKKWTKAYIKLKLPRNYRNEELKFRVWDEIIKLSTDSQWEVNIKKKWLIKMIQDMWINLA